MSFKKIFTSVLLLMIILVLINFISSFAATTSTTIETYAQKLQDTLDSALEVGSRGYHLGVSAAIIVPGHKNMAWCLWGFSPWHSYHPRDAF